MFDMREVHDGVAGRYHASDERDIGFRATWRPAYGFINLSLWRDGLCVETFHLTPAQASTLIGFIASSLAAAVPPPSRGVLALLPDPALPPAPQRTTVGQAMGGFGLRCSAAVERASRRLLSR